MVEVTTTVQSPQPPSHDERHRARVERMQKLRQRPGVRVVPKNDTMRRLLKHPKTGNFRAEGGLEWPNDTFTQKRLRDGDVTVEEKAEKADPKAKPQSPRPQPTPTPEQQQ